MEGNFDGWIAVNEPWTYASSDSPTFTFTIAGDKTSKYSPGMRIKLTQTSIKYFIITAVSYSNPNTTVTVYGGTDYTLTNASIEFPYYSEQKAPFGFPLNPQKWTVELSDSSDRSQSSPTANTWYNLGSLSVDIPVGSWFVDYQVCASNNRSSTGVVDQYATLSTANNSESDTNFTTRIADLESTGISATLRRGNVINITSKTTYYLNSKTISTSITQIFWLGGGVHPTIVRAVCSFL